MSTDSDSGLKAAGADDSQPQFTPRLGFNHLAEEYDGDEVCACVSMCAWTCACFCVCVCVCMHVSVRSANIAPAVLRGTDCCS